MRPLELAIIYLLVGLGCAVALASRAGALGPRAIDAGLALLLWPLIMPFALMRAREPAPDADVSAVESAFLDAVRRAAATPLGKLLPDAEVARALGVRLREAAARVADIDGLLAQPDFSLERAQRRRAELQRGGDRLALDAVEGRIQNLLRLSALRDRFARELDAVAELLAQLRTQAEVVRLSGGPDGDTRERVAELLARIEGLDAVLGDDPALPPP
ncbi:MAG: hypothetical protein H6744_01040 [Deltaproteobacteria bacterium]|nr:hypothetical protein [Deltaproteobacteria bacterium]